MASHLETELGKLRSIIIKIGGLAENQAVRQCFSEPVLESKEVKKTENKIDKLDVKIDDICQSVLLCNNLLLRFTIYHLCNAN
jgi:phosphate transport system protein